MPSHVRRDILAGRAGKTVMQRTKAGPLPDSADVPRKLLAAPFGFLTRLHPRFLQSPSLFSGEALRARSKSGMNEWQRKTCIALIKGFDCK